MPKVFRPRLYPLLTGFDTAMGKKYVWTTFSEDQVDLNFHNPRVTLEILDVFLFYLSQGIEIIRLDAIGYVWKEPDSSCVNLPQTHDMVKLFRTVAEYVAPYAVILTEVNFPYEDNISYLEARHEANMAYHFSLPPLVIDGFASKDTSYLQEETNRIRQDLVFFNFLASHDGIGLLAAKGILPPPRFQELLGITIEHGGLISYKAGQEGKVPYELNITFYDAINDPSHPDQEIDVRRFMAANSIMLADKGVPGIYIHCLLGSRNFLQGVKDTGTNRMINREKLSEEGLLEDLSNPESLRCQVLGRYLHLLRVRRQIRAFHHSVKREVLKSDKRLFIMERLYEEGSVFAVVSVSDDSIGLPQYQGKYDFISKTPFEGKVEPYGVYFLK
jgi:glycosidase